jgi:glycosyltransferase involved in cell wall biosynthesis
MDHTLETDTAAFTEQQLAASTAAIVRSSLFAPAYYSEAANLPRDSDLHTAIADYLTRGEREGLCPHCLFDPRFVRRQFEELGTPLVNGSALLTYLAHPDAPVDPHPVFDHTRYVREKRGITHLEDYVCRVRGGAMPPSPHIVFDREFYRGRYPRVEDALMNYLWHGWKGGRQPHPLFDINFFLRSLSVRGIQHGAGDPLTLYCIDRSTWSVGTHPLFDLRQFLDALSRAGLSPSSRYPPLADMLLGDAEISSHPLFDPAFYRGQARNRGIEVAEHPLLHYARGDRNGQLDPHPLFCEWFYRDRYPDVAGGEGSALEHFVNFGQAEGRDPNPLFSQKYYRSANAMVARGEIKALEHYIASAGTLLEPHPLFDAATYVARNPECLRSDETPLGHYSRTWAEHGLRFPPWGTSLFPRRQTPHDRHAPDVILVSHELTRSGAPAILLSIVKDLVARRGLRTLVLAVRGGDLLEDFCEWSAVVDLTLARMADVNDATFMASLRASFGEHWRPRLVIVNSAGVDQAAITFGGNLPTITLVHELASAYPEARFRSIYSNSDLVIYPAEFVRNEAHVLYSLPVEKTAVLPQGLLDPEFGSGDAQQARAALLEEIEAEPNAFIVLGCGTTDMRKGIDTFVHVARASLRAAANESGGRPLHFVWIGGGHTPAQTSIHSALWYARQDIDRSGFAERVHFLGPRRSTETYFLACDAFLMTSRMDPFPCVIHEAMACAKPIIAFADSGGAAEALRNGAGIVVDYGDVVAMTEQLMRLRHEPDLAHTYGASARDVVRSRYVFSDYVDRMLALAQDRLAVAFPKPVPCNATRRQRGRVIFTCGDSEPQGSWRLFEFLVAALIERGFDAQLLFTGTTSALALSNRSPSVPLGLLATSFGKSGTYKQRWDALARVIGVSDPIVLVHNVDPIASALAPVPSSGMGILGIVSEASQEQLEQAARLGRYWQRAVTHSESLAARVLDVAPFLRDRLVVIPPPIHRYPAPARRDPDGPLRIIVSGSHPRRDSSMTFLVPLVRGLQAARVPFVVTAVNSEGEAQLLKTNACAEVSERSVRIVESTSSQELSELLPANDVLLLLSEGSCGIDLLEAMCAGLAVVMVAKDADADKPLRDGIQGFRVPMANVQTCVERLGRLAADRGLLEQMRCAAHDAGRSAPDFQQVCDAYATLVAGMLDALHSRSYTKPPPLYVDPVFGALSLPPMFHLEPGEMGFSKKP